MQTDRTTAARTRAPRLPAEERRVQILDAATTVFAKQGYAGTGTADIAREAGIGEPTLYRYFANKRDLFVAAVERSSADVRAQWESVARAAPDPLTALQQIGLWHYERMQRHPELLLLRFRSFTESPDEEATSIVREEYRTTLRFVESLLRDAHARGQVGDDTDVRALMWLFLAVGCMLDVTQILGLNDELKPAEVMRLASLLGSFGHQA
jgi:AcrR family transcriptional regulator